MSQVKDDSGRYSVAMEVAAPLAIFTRPDTGGAPSSYPVPTWSAAKGILESIAFFRDGSAWFHPIRVEVCRSIGTIGGVVLFQHYTTNYGGPMRKSDLFDKGMLSGGSSMQLAATVLNNVCYRIHATVAGGKLPNRNPRHHLKDLFDRRLARGQCYRTPCLGWSEFTCSYWGGARTSLTEVDDQVCLTIPSMLVRPWGEDVASGADACYEPEFRRDVKVERGVLLYAPQAGITGNAGGASDAQ